MTNRISVKEASNLLGVTEQFLRVALQQGIFSFGVAVKLQTQGRESNIYTYYINRSQLNEYLRTSSKCV